MKGSPVQAALMIMSLCTLIAHGAQAGDDQRPLSSLPQFASLKKSKTNVRVGPGTKYPIRWIYKRQGLPVEIMAEFGNWRRVRGSDGSDGWVHRALLSNRRTALASPWSKDSVSLRSTSAMSAPVIARLEPEVLVRIHQCDGKWCSVSVPKSDISGYVRQVKLWGVYPDEAIGQRSHWYSLEHLL